MFDLEKLIDTLRSEFEGLEYDNADLRRRLIKATMQGQMWKQRAEALEKELAELRELQTDTCERVTRTS